MNSPRLLNAVAIVSAQWLVGSCVWLCLLLPLGRAQTVDNYNIGFFHYAFGGVPENDALAAFKSWVRVIGQESGLTLHSASKIFHDRASALDAAHARQIDILILSSIDYLAIAPKLPRGVLMAPAQDSGPGEEYLLICHREAAGQTLADFRGRSLVLQDNARALQANLWLEFTTQQAGLPRPTSFFSQIISAAKPAKVLLPVYFKQADLCLITATAYRTLCELNPQLDKQVRILSRSPRLTSTVIWLSLPEGSALHAAAHAAIANLHQTTSGRQTMILFQFSRVDDCPDSALDSTRELLRHLPPEIADPAPPSRSAP